MDSAEAYEMHAHQFLKGRDISPTGIRVIDQWTRMLRRGATVIELGCGGGYPVTRVLSAAGLQLWAIDSSPTLVDKFRSRFPSIPIQCEKVQESDFFGRNYEGVVTIGLVFLLSELEQADLISRVSDMLVRGGRFLFMAPIQSGTWKDLNTGVECTSLGKERYEELLKNVGLCVVDTYTDVGENNYYDAEKPK